jgi:hypothetical protein
MEFLSILLQYQIVTNCVDTYMYKMGQFQIFLHSTQTLNAFSFPYLVQIIQMKTFKCDLYIELWKN